jgi:hypothetical protein
MTLQEAISVFIRQTDPNLTGDAMELFEDYSRAAGLASIDQITAPAIRDFLARWYIELAADRKLASPQILISSLATFFKWADEHCGAKIAANCAPVLSELEQSLPRAIEITSALSKHLSERGGAFGFPEFLTSFEQGGHSEYDVGGRGEVSAIEGYFLIERVEGERAKAVEIVTETRAWPLVFPEEVARLIVTGFIINLEIVRAGDSWQIAGCGFAFPPNTVMSDEY